jgi:hypothetical protein
MRRVVWSAAAAIPVVVALLYVLPAPGDLSAETQRQLFLLPRLNALLNGSAFVCLVAAYIAVRSKRIAVLVGVQERERGIEARGARAAHLRHEATDRRVPHIAQIASAFFHQRARFRGDPRTATQREADGVF